MTEKALMDKIYEYITSRRKNISSIELYERLKSRKKPSVKKLYEKGTVILALDHTARMNIAVGDNKYALLNRKELLYRAIELLLNNYVDGVLVIPDILDELLIADEFFEKEVGRSIIDDKIIIGSINRGGLSGAVFELNDIVTAYTPRDILRLNLDAAKVLLRIDLNNYDTLKTIDYVQAISRECDKLRIPLFIEVFPVRRANNGYETINDPYELAKTINVASALGFSSLNKILKVPYVNNFQVIVESTTLPIYILGGGSGRAREFCDNLKQAIKLAPNVIGAVAGRNILYPTDMDFINAAKCVKSAILL